MNVIELERWKPSEDNPRISEYVGQRTALEVFEELKARLDGMGFLPDEYFLLDRHWEDGREIPKDADIFCATDYGESEGVYLDVYLKWYEGNKPVTRSFITGKTLGESGSDLDRMFLISSAITKAFHGDRGTHARYMVRGQTAQSEGMVLHLNAEEQRTFIDALARQRERSLADVDRTERLLRRMTGSILPFIDEMGCQPMHLSAEDKAMIAIRDGDVNAFCDALPDARKHTDALLVQAAGRPGNAGYQMTARLLASVEQFSAPAYLDACKRAVDIGDFERVDTLTRDAQEHAPELGPGHYGEVIQYAYRERQHIAGQLIRQATPAQIAAAPSCLLYQAVTCSDYQSQYALMEKGIDTNDRAADILHYLCCGHKEYEAASLLQSGLNVAVNNFMALHACVKNNAPEAAKAVLDQGMDYGQYHSWAVRNGYSEGSQELIATLSEHWASLHPEQEQAQKQSDAPDPAPQTGGMTLG